MLYDCHTSVNPTPEYIQFAQVTCPHRPSFAAIKENGAGESLVDSDFSVQSYFILRLESQSTEGGRRIADAVGNVFLSGPVAVMIEPRYLNRSSSPRVSELRTAGCFSFERGLSVINFILLAFIFMPIFQTYDRILSVAKLSPISFCCFVNC